jgi:hypothetical protein
MEIQSGKIAMRKDVIPPEPPPPPDNDPDAQKLHEIALKLYDDLMESP